jgi:hypothetical protein
MPRRHAEYCQIAAAAAIDDSQLSLTAIAIAAARFSLISFRRLLMPPLVIAFTLPCRLLLAIRCYALPTFSLFSISPPLASFRRLIAALAASRFAEAAIDIFAIAAITPYFRYAIIEDYYYFAIIFAIAIIIADYFILSLLLPFSLFSR